MRLFRRLQLRLSWMLRRSKGEIDLNDELQDYVARQTEVYLGRGLPPQQARIAALRDVDGLEQVKEECRDARGTPWIETTLQDVRYAWRTLCRTPGFTAAAICALALGIGANTAIFDVINGVILRPLPYLDPNRLVSIEQLRVPGGIWSFSYPDYVDCASQIRSFHSMAAWRNRGVNLTAPGEPEFLPTRQVSASFLRVLGIQPLLGRNFTVEEDQPGAAPVVIITHSLWQQRFGGRREAVGSRIVLNGKGYTVVGILPAGFQFRDDRPLLTPIGQNDEIGMRKRDFHAGIQAIARLAADIDLHNANAELGVIGERLATVYPATNKNFTFHATPLKEELVGNAGSTLFLLGGAVGMVLLIACVNVANLFLARSVSREREFAVRAALGAGRLRLIRQLLTESLLLSLLSGMAGLLVAATGTRLVIANLPGWLPRTGEIMIDARVMMFTLGASVLSGIAFGLVPSLRQQVDLEASLKQGSHGSGRGVRKAQSAFVIAELALSFVLLTGAGLMMRTILQLWNVPLGFDPRNLLTMNTALPPKDLKDPSIIRKGWEQTLDRVRSTAGVQAAALDSIVPLSGDTQNIAYWTTNEIQPPKNALSAFLFTPTPGYLQTMRIPLLQGRFFTQQDRLGSEPVIVIDETLATRHFSQQNPLGQELSVQWLGKARIVGVVGAIKHNNLDESVHQAPRPAIYLPFFQIPDSFMQMTTAGMSLLVRSSRNPVSMLQAVKNSAVGPARDAPVRDMATMEQIIAFSMGRRRGIAVLLGVFAVVAWLLSAVGIYSVVSYATSLRVREIGIRMALGAQPGQVVRFVMSLGVRMIAAGVLLGIAGSLAATRLLVKLLFGVTPADPATLAAAAAALCCVALLAILFPARRSTRVDPVLTLRDE
jgi:predicted permease